MGIDAFHYLDLHLNHYATKEPLLIALGGFPFALKSNIEREIQALKTLGITCVFVFSGLEFGKKEHSFAAQAESARALDQAWNFYDQQQAEQVVDAFSAAGWSRICLATESLLTLIPLGSAKPDSLFKFLQRILHEQGVEFMVAPYSAAAQVSLAEANLLVPQQMVLISNLACIPRERPEPVRRRRFRIVRTLPLRRR